MDTWVKDTIRNIQACRDITEMKGILATVQTKLAFQFFLYGVALPSGFTNIRHFIITNYPEPWMQEYTERNYATIDPVVKHCSEHRDPCFWNVNLKSDNPEVRSFFKTAAEFGLVSGISVGMHSNSGGFNIFSLATNRMLQSDTDEALEVVFYINALFPYIHEAVKNLSSYQHTEAHKPELTPREIDCLIWSAEGKTADEIAQILSISAPTATFHLKNAINKLEVTNRNQAIAKAVLYGLIAPQYSTLSLPKTYLF